MPTYSTILTTYGLAQVATAISTGVPINLTHLAVGDGSGAAAAPLPGQTALVNERHRVSINTLVADPADPTVYRIEGLIPASVGGWTIREFGVFDDDGMLFSVGNFPDTYKTTISDGAINDLIIRVDVKVSNAGVITLILDPSIAIASRAWVLSNINTAYLLPGGTTGQHLRKRSNTDGDVEWAAPDAGNLLVSAVEEPVQFIAASQLTVNLTVTTTLGLAVYIEGVRIPKMTGPNGWQQGASITQVVLGRQYPVGSQFFACQNEPASLLPDPLDATQNLGDLDNAVTARANLGVLSIAQTREMQPPGNVTYTAAPLPPTGWLVANGAAISRSAYSALYAAIGTIYGAGDGSSTFNLPDLRGVFIRALDGGRGIDVGRTLGSDQLSQNLAHTHEEGAGPYTSHGFIAGGGDAFSTTQPRSQTGSSGGSEARPRNIALLPIIKY